MTEFEMFKKPLTTREVTLLQASRMLVCFVVILFCACENKKPPPEKTQGINVTPGTGKKRLKDEKSPRRAIIFIHGITGSSVETWRSPRTGAESPTLLSEDPGLPVFDTYAIGYDSPVVGLSMGLEEVSTGIISRIRDDGLYERYDQLFIIAHSMGGLIAERLLIDFKTSGHESEGKKIRALITLGTPQDGVSFASVAGLFSKNAQLDDLKLLASNSWLQALQNQLVQFRNGRTDGYPRMFAAYETTAVPLLNQVLVPRGSVATSWDAVARPLTANHIDIAKPANRSSEIYTWVSARLKESSKPTPTPTPMAAGSQAVTQKPDVASSPFVETTPKPAKIRLEFKNDTFPKRLNNEIRPKEKARILATIEAEDGTPIPSLSASWMTQRPGEFVRSDIEDKVMGLTGLDPHEEASASPVSNVKRMAYDKPHAIVFKVAYKGLSNQIEIIWKPKPKAKISTSTAKTAKEHSP